MVIATNLATFEQTRSTTQRRAEAAGAPKPAKVAQIPTRTRKQATEATRNTNTAKSSHSRREKTMSDEKEPMKNCGQCANWYQFPVPVIGYENTGFCTNDREYTSPEPDEECWGFEELG